MSASCRSTLLGPGTSAGDVRNALSRGIIGSLYLARCLPGMYFVVPASFLQARHGQQGRVLPHLQLSVGQNLQLYPCLGIENTC